MKAREYNCKAGCPVEATLDLIGGRWKGVVLYNLIDGPVRFNELRRQIPGATQRVLTRQLRELEAVGMISRTVTPSIPPRVDYELTELGRSLSPVIAALRDWGAEYLEEMKARRASAVVEPGAREPLQPVAAE
ncbi:winged helix-turn-helix transcriptional regulator [Flaviflagellibacter deserti]|uniref:Winged helix-turn-helix transcriptional regulator n=1 Tax=Flaviflagellibacter deserti TaxID=2267266 RepID=A0ABV9YYE5_9HYPH